VDIEELEDEVDNFCKSHENLHKKINLGRIAEEKMNKLLLRLDGISIDSSYQDLRIKKKDITTKLNNMADFTLSHIKQVIYMYSHVLSD